MIPRGYLGKWYENLTYLDHPIRLAPRWYACSSRPAHPSPTLLLLGCHLPLLQGRKKCPIKTHKVNSTQSKFNAHTSNLIKHWIMDCAALPKGRFLGLWILSQKKSFSFITLSCNIWVCHNLKSCEPLSSCATVCFCVYIVLYMYICCELTGSSCVLLCKRSSHECLQEQEEAPWNRKESNVWERGGYLLPFDLLWSELECVL